MKKFISLLFFSLGMFFSTASFSGVITFENSFSLNETVAGDTNLTGSSSSLIASRLTRDQVFLSGFDTSLGVLNSINLFLDPFAASFTTFYRAWDTEFGNFSDKSNFISGFATAQIRATTSLGGSIPGASTTRRYSCTDRSTSGVNDANCGGEFDFGFDPLTQGFSISHLPLSSFYTSNLVDDLFRIDVSSILSISASCDGSPDAGDFCSASIRQNGSWNGIARVSYFYTEADGTSCDDGNPATINDQFINGTCTGSTPSATVPEPSVIALMGLGIMGLGFARRRKQQA